MNPIDRLSKLLMRLVVDTGAVNESNTEKAIAVMREELHEFLTGDEYKNDRESLELNSVNPEYVLKSLVASCVIKIRA